MLPALVIAQLVLAGEGLVASWNGASDPLSGVVHFYVALEVPLTSRLSAADLAGKACLVLGGKGLGRGPRGVCRSGIGDPIIFRGVGRAGQIAGGQVVVELICE